MWNGLERLLLSRRLLVSLLYISPSMATVSGLIPASLIVSYSVRLSMESKAFLRSIRHQYRGFSFFFALSAIVSRMKIWSWHVFPFRKAACSSEMMLNYSVSSSMRSFTILSRTLYHMFRSEIGLCSSGRFDGGCVFGISTMFACFIACGTYHSLQTLPIRTIVILSAICPAPFKSSAEIPSGPVAFLLFSLCMLVIISDAVGGSTIAAIGGSMGYSSL